MQFERRQLLRTGLAASVAAILAAAPPGAVGAARSPRVGPRLDDWDDIRRLFPLTADFLHFGGLYIASHPEPVSRAIEAHRRALDTNPVHELQDRGAQHEAAVLRAAAAYLGVGAGEIALTDSTTMGLGLLYNGLDVRPGDELLTTTHDFSATHQALAWKAERSGATVRRVSLYADPARADADQIVAALVAAVRPETRVIAITWVHSSTGVKLPVARIAAALARLNATRAEGERALLCVDGVHGLGVEADALPDLGCDVFVAGCHKWLFGPRGTGLVWGRPAAWTRLTPTIPSFSGGGPGAAMTPGGFHSFEHRWALNEAFDLHLRIGKARIAARIHDLNRELKDGLAAMPHVTLYTPRDPALSAGLACFDVRGLAPRSVVARLRERAVIATTTPYSPTYARLAAGLLNMPDEVDRVLAEIRALA